MANRADYRLIVRAAELTGLSAYDLALEAAKDAPSRGVLVQDAKICLSLSEQVLRVLGEPAVFDVRARIEAMRDRPVMWADTREGFVLQLKLLMDVFGVPVERSRGWMSTACGSQWSDTIDNDWGALVAASALRMIDASAPQPAQQEVAAGEADASPKQ